MVVLLEELLVDFLEALLALLVAFDAMVGLQQLEEPERIHL